MKRINLEELKQKAIPILKQAKVKKAAFFGSYARGTYIEESDIDILIEVPRGTTLIDMVGIKQDLEETLQKNVDIVTYNSIHPKLRESIINNQYPIL